jgi:hypothetical protein
MSDPGDKKSAEASPQNAPNVAPESASKNMANQRFLFMRVAMAVHLMPCLTFPDLHVWRQVCHQTKDLTTAYYKDERKGPHMRVWEYINSKFPPEWVCTFRDFMSETGAALTGLLPLQVLTGASWKSVGLEVIAVANGHTLDTLQKVVGILANSPRRNTARRSEVPGNAVPGYLRLISQRWGHNSGRREREEVASRIQYEHVGFVHRPHTWGHRDDITLSLYLLETATKPLCLCGNNSSCPAKHYIVNIVLIPERNGIPVGDTLFEYVTRSSIMSVCANLVTLQSVRSAAIQDLMNKRAVLNTAIFCLGVSLDTKTITFPSKDESKRSAIRQQVAEFTNMHVKLTKERVRFHQDLHQNTADVSVCKCSMIVLGNIINFLESGYSVELWAESPTDQQKTAELIKAADSAKAAKKLIRKTLTPLCTRYGITKCGSRNPPCLTCPYCQEHPETWGGH